MEPMQLGSTRLMEERLRGQKDGLCFYCGQLSHIVSVCPVKGGKVKDKVGLQVSQNIMIDSPAQPRMMSAVFASENALQFPRSLTKDLMLTSSIHLSLGGCI